MKQIFLLFAVFVLLWSGQTNAQTNNVLNFDGVGDNVTVPGIGNSTGNFTIEVYAKATYHGYAIVSYIETGARGWTISFEGSDRPIATIGNGGNWISVPSINPCNFNQWYHYAMVYNSTNYSMSFYVDGILQGSDYNVMPVWAVGNDASFKIGSDYWNL